MASSPRNHFYRTGQSLTEFGLFCIGLDAKLDHLENLADDLELKPVINGAYQNVLD